MQQAEVIKVPRNFKLLGELEKTEKGLANMSVSYGLVQDDDIYMSDWRCTILGPMNSSIENRIISLRLNCDKSYPDKPPTCTFESKLNFPFIDSKGNFTATTKINWNSQNSSIESFLMEMRALMIKPEYKKNKQPEESLTY